MAMKLKRFSLLFCFVLLIFGIAVMSVALPRANSASAEGELVGTVEYAVGGSSSKYADESYRSFYRVKSAEISSVSATAQANYPVANAIDFNTSSSWVSAEENTDTFANSLEVTFGSSKKIESVFYATVHFSSIRQFIGYPTKLKVYAASSGGEYTLVGEFSSTPVIPDSTQTVFVLPRAVECTKIKLEFAEVFVPNGTSWAWANGKKFAAAGDIQFFTEDMGVALKKPQNAVEQYANATFLDGNSVTAEEMKVRASGAGDIGKAFDKNTATYWQSESANTALFKNKVTMTFEKTQNIEKIVYAPAYYTRNNGRIYSGFPSVLKVYAAESENDELSLRAVFAGVPTGNWDKILFDFGEEISCRKLALEFTEVTVYSAVENGAAVAVAGEIYAIKREDATLNETLETINGLFEDYAQTVVKEGYTLDDIDDLREKAKTSAGYEDSLKPLLDRAEGVLSGAVRKEVYREFGVVDPYSPNYDPDDPITSHYILQTGDLRGYAYGTLHHSSFGTNRQVTGIAANTGDRLTVYVDCEDGDPLPSIVCTQIYGAWNSWQATYALHKGKNEIVFPNFKAHGNYSRPIAAGGPIHIVNPYTSEQQSSNVKIYIEGGALYPVFRYGDNEETFKMILKNYYERLNDPNDSGVTVDCFEAVTNNIMLSCTASLAYASYINNGTSPQLNVDKWDDYIIRLLKFGGVQFDEGEPYYNPMNEYIKVNVRAVQPYAGFYAFAAGDHVGLIDAGTFGAMVQKWSTGWAIAHEIGHMLDNNLMKKPENSNNMWAIYTIYMVNGSFNDRINVTNVSACLSPDSSSWVGNYWPNGNCAFWWIIEGAHPGYWAKLQNLYNFGPGTGLTHGNELSDLTERLAYYSSIATGTNMSEYFERWGFTFGTEKFTLNGASDKYKEMIAELITKGVITAEGKKFWYVNNAQYKLERDHGEKLEASWAACYNEGETVSATQITAAGNVHTITLPQPRNADAHLCYEIQGYVNGEWKVLGVTYGTVFTDNTNYGTATPKYKIYAYDRMFNHTGDPAEQVPVESERQTDVCRIGEVKYDSLKEAVAAAQAGDTIYLLKDMRDSGIALNKALTILPDPLVFAAGESVTIIKNSAGHLLSITASGVTLGSQTGNVPTSAKIILDGNGFSQNGSLVYISGVMTTLNNVRMQNNITTDKGGGLYVNYGGGCYLNGCEIVGNTAGNGGGIYQNGATKGISIRGLKLMNNVATSKGGGAYVSQYQGGSVMHNNDTVNGEYPAFVVSGNRADLGGGIYSENNVILHAVEFTDNAARLGGGFYSDIDNTGRNAQLYDCDFYGNTATQYGSATYLNRGEVRISGGNYGGTVYKAFGGKPAAVMSLVSKLPDFSEAVFECSIPLTDEGVVLFDNVSGLSASDVENAALAFTVKNGVAEFVAGTGIVAKSSKASVTVNYGSGTLTDEWQYGAFVLPLTLEGLGENSYVESYTIGGRTYAAGDRIEVAGDMTVNAVVKEYFKVTLRYDGGSEVLKVTQGYEYYLPMKTPDGIFVFGWNCSDGNYYAYAQGVAINGNVEFEAVTKKRFEVTVVIDELETSSEYEYCSWFLLPEPHKMFGKVFSHWEIDGRNYAAGATVQVVKNMRAVAVYTASWKVVTVIEDEETVENYRDGAEIILPNPEKSLGREFKYWSINGVKYYAGMKYTVRSDAEMQAVFMSRDRIPDEFTITLTYNRGQVADSDETVENETKVERRAFNDEYIFVAAPVNAGNKFMYWESNGIRYDVGDKIVVTDNLNLTGVVVPISDAEIETTVKISVDDFVNGVFAKTDYSYDVGETVYLWQPEPKDGVDFAYWLVNGEKMFAGTTLTVEQPMTVSAVYEVKVTFGSLVDGVFTKTSEATYKTGDTFALPEPPKAPEGKRFVHWLVNYEKHNVGDVITVGDVLNVAAVFEDVEKSNKGLIIALVVVSLVLAAGIAVAVLIVVKKYKKKNGTTSETDEKKSAKKEKKAATTVEAQPVSETAIVKNVSETAERAKVAADKEPAKTVPVAKDAVSKKSASAKKAEAAEKPAEDKKKTAKKTEPKAETVKEKPTKKAAAKTETGTGKGKSKKS